MNRDTLLDLARRVEQATGADDADSRLALFALGTEIMRACGRDYLGVNPLLSLDAAAALVPSGWSTSVMFGGTWNPPCVASTSSPTFTRVHRAGSATPALALTAAALKARAEEAGDGE